MKKIVYIFSLLLVICVADLKAQDNHFSNINEAPLFNSPANTGFFNGYFRAIVNYRSQWAAMNKAFQTIAVSVDGGLFKSRRRKAFLGMGLTVFNDKAGSANLQKTNALLNVSGIIKTGKRSAFSVGIAGGVSSNNANYSKLTYASQFDGNNIDNTIASGETVVYRQFTTTDIAAGAAWEYSKVKTDQDHDDVSSIKISVGAFHLNKPVQDFGPGSAYRIPVRTTGQIITHFDFEDTKFSVTPTLLYSRQGQAWQFVTGSYIKYRVKVGTKVTGQKTENGIGIGLFYRSKDAIIPTLIYEVGDIAFFTSYDINVSGYRAATRYAGGFEIGFRFNNLASSLFESRSEFK
ncbi:MAG: PorP/SprF family type IX secretion system membrane protein [Bacteroidetes bacterium]|nr:PorP/SprF family type IX secretion system membrane protein [Bacteroidota bacterium]